MGYTLRTSGRVINRTSASWSKILSSFIWGLLFFFFLLSPKNVSKRIGQPQGEIKKGQDFKVKSAEGKEKKLQNKSWRKTDRRAVRAGETVSVRIKCRNEKKIYKIIKKYIKINRKNL